MQGVPATMAASDLVDLSGLMDDAKCFALVRQRRWPEGARCPGCGSDVVIRDGRDDTLVQGYANPLKRLDTSESVNLHKCLILLDSCPIHATRWRRAVPHQGLAVSPGRALVRRGGSTAAPVALSGLRSRRDGDELARALPLDPGAGSAA